MQGYNVILVYAEKEQTILMCLRKKNPYKNKYNLPGGKIENENHLQEAYRELLEETGISQIKLTHLLTLVYPIPDFYIEAYAGTITQECALIPEENPLLWMTLSDNDFSDSFFFAGESSIKHIIEYAKVMNIIKNT